MARSLAYEPSNALNAICPYFTMFPLEYPLRVLDKHKKEKPIIMDPFCGRGTTLFAARSIGLDARGIDSSPVAVAIAQAKLCKLSTEEVLALAGTYIKNEKPKLPTSVFFKHAFQSEVLHHICAIRQGLLKAEELNDEVVLLRAAMLGCLHGPMSKTLDNQSYFSNQMPRTFSSKPDYSVRYWKSHKLKAPSVNVVSVLKRKLSRITLASTFADTTYTSARLGDSRLASSLPQKHRDFSLVITSPPYYGMKTYVQDQWLRNWFLGGDEFINYSNHDQLDHGGTDVFSESLGRVWKNMSRTNADDLDMYVRFGAIPSSETYSKDIMYASLEASGVNWKIVSVRSAKTAASGKRQADHMTVSSTAAEEYDFHICRN